MTDERLEYEVLTNDYDGIKRHIDRYLYAMKYCQGKTVLDVGCGSGLGGFLYSMVAKLVLMIDYSGEALKSAARFPFVSEVELIQQDISGSYNFPKVDTIVAFEIIEHLDNPKRFLNKLYGDTIVWSVPMNDESEWHKTVFQNEEEIRKLFAETNWKVQELFTENGRYVHGYCIK